MPIDSLSWSVTEPTKPAFAMRASMVSWQDQRSCFATSGRNVALRWQRAIGSAQMLWTQNSSAEIRPSRHPEPASISILYGDSCKVRWLQAWMRSIEAADSASEDMRRRRAQLKVTGGLTKELYDEAVDPNRPVPPGLCPLKCAQQRNCAT